MDRDNASEVDGADDPPQAETPSVGMWMSARAGELPGQQALSSVGRRGDREISLPSYVVDLIESAVVWLSGGVGVGVLGNATYDAMKAALSRLRRDRSGETGSVANTTTADVVALALSALQLRCHELGISVPREDQINRADTLRHGKTRWLVRFYGLRLHADVRLDLDVKGDERVKADVDILAHPHPRPSARRTQSKPD